MSTIELAIIGSLVIAGMVLVEVLIRYTDGIRRKRFEDKYGIKWDH